ncbi:MAG: NEAT domain-containing protein, partial [Clostridiales Family XIII bacterium]|nr:NEAT domain-containing protein [Clostridiales Family XIII bacterium]
DINLKVGILEELGRGSEAAGLSDEDIKALVVTDDEMKSLTTLDLPDRGITDITGLRTATNLIELDLSDNPIGGAQRNVTTDAANGIDFLANEFQTLAKLRTLDLSGCSLGDCYLMTGNFAQPRDRHNGLFLSVLPALRHADLSDNGLTGRFQFTTGNLFSNLRTLDISDNRLGGILHFEAKFFPALQRIDASGNYLNWDEGEDWIGGILDVAERIDHDGQKNLATAYAAMVAPPGTTSFSFANVAFRTAVQFTEPGADNIFTFPTAVGGSDVTFAVAALADIDPVVKVTVKENGDTFDAQSNQVLSQAGSNSLSTYTLRGLAPGEHDIEVTLAHDNGDTQTYTLKVTTVAVPRGTSDDSAGVKDDMLHFAVCANLGITDMTHELTKADMANITGVLTVNGATCLDGIEYATNSSFYSLTITGTERLQAVKALPPPLTSLAINTDVESLPDFPPGLETLTLSNYKGKISDLKAFPATLTMLVLAGEFTDAPAADAIAGLTALRVLSINSPKLSSAPDYSRDGLPGIMNLTVAAAVNGDMPDISGFTKLTLLNIYNSNGKEWPKGIENSVNLAGVILINPISGSTFSPLRTGNKAYNLTLTGAPATAGEHFTVDISGTNGAANTWFLNNQLQGDTLTVKGASDTLFRFATASSNSTANLSAFYDFSEGFSAPNVTSFQAPFDDAEILDSILRGMPKITSLDLNYSTIKYLPPAVGTLTDLATFTLYGSGVERIDADLSNAKLTTFDARASQLTGALDMGKLPATLTTLSLNASRINYLTGDFSHLTKLATINTMDAPLLEVPSGIKDLPALKTLNLSYGYYGDIPEDIFDNVNPSLRTSVTLSRWIPGQSSSGSSNILNPVSGSSTEKARATLLSKGGSMGLSGAISGANVGKAAYSMLLKVDSDQGTVSGKPWETRNLSIALPEGTSSVTLTPGALMADTDITIGDKTVKSGEGITLANLSPGNNRFTVTCFNDFQNYLLTDKTTVYELTVFVGGYASEVEEGRYYQVPFEVTKLGSAGAAPSMSNPYYEHTAIVSRKADGRYEVRLTVNASSIVPWIGYFEPGKAEAVVGDKIGVSGLNTTWRIYSYADTFEERLPFRMFAGPMGSYQTAEMTFDMSKLVDVTASMPDVDKTDLVAAIGAAESVNTWFYTAASVATLENAVAAANSASNKLDASQTEVDDAIAAVAAALAALVPDESKLADKATLGNLIDEADALEQGGLTDTAWNTLQESVADAKELQGNIEVTQKEVDAMVKTLRSVVTLYISSGAASGLDKDSLTDGTYSLLADMIKTNHRDYSMSNDAIGHNVKLTVEDGRYYLTVSFKGLYVPGFESVGNFGYLSRLWYYDPVAYDNYGNPTGEAKDATVSSYQTNPDGSAVVDRYNDASNPYPKEIKFPLVNGAAYEDNFVPLRVFVPIMDAISAGSGYQDVLMRLDWTTLKSATDDDFTVVDTVELGAKIAEAAVIPRGAKSAEAYAALQDMIATVRAVLGRADASQAEVDAALAALAAAVVTFNGSADDVAGGDNTGKNGTGGDNTGGNNTGGDNTGGNNTGNNNIGGDTDLNKSPDGTIVTSLSSLKITAADKVWTGKKIAAGFVLTAGGKTLALGTDYTVASTGANKNIGAGTVQIAGKGGYTGTVTVKFRIVPKAVSVKSATPG